MNAKPINLYFQAVTAVHGYTESDVEELLSACSDQEKIALDRYVKEYLEKYPSKGYSGRSKTDRKVLAIAVIFDTAARKAEKNLSLPSSENDNCLSYTKQ